ncbi:MAG: hypothetical protein ACREYF_01760 [Gammaproteobacteria bacterium]
MTSFLRSRFNLTPRRALLLASESITVYHWEQGRITHSLVFDNDESGLAFFARYLSEALNAPLYVLVDMVEEEFRQDTIPHVSGADRRTVLQRKQRRVFRGTDYFYSEVQGREAEGRKDDQVLLTGLLNPDALAPWLKVLEQHKTPVAGVYSLAVLSEILLREVASPAGHTLLVSLQSASGLRQSYFQNAFLKMSRLAKMPRFGTTPYAPIVMLELEKFCRYLISLRLFTREDRLDVYILAHGELLTELRRSCIDSPHLRYRLLDVTDLGQRLEIEGVLTTTFSDILYAHKLLSQVPKNHYASSAQVRYFTMHRLRTALMSASMLALVGSAVWGGFNLVDGLSLRYQAVDAKQKALFYQARFEEARKRLPPTAVAPSEIKTAIETVRTLDERKATPFALLTAISAALASFPEISLETLTWEASSTPNKPSPTAAGLAPALGATGQPGDYLYYQTAIIKGEILPFDGDYRTALSMVDEFAAALRSSPQVVEVKIEQRPLDVSSEAMLSGEVGSEGREKNARFALLVIMGVPAEHA